jgi:hypothetical protein
VWSAALIACIVSLFFNRILFTNQSVLPFDVEFWHFPQEAFLVDQLARGHFPLWTPLVYGGMPFAANMQAAAFYPVNLGAMFVIAHVVGHLPYKALEILEIGHVYLAGMSAYALGRHYRLGVTSSIACGVTYMLGPNMVSQVQHIGLIESAAWVPLIALYVHRAYSKGSVVDAMLAAVFWSFCFLAGFFAAAIPVALVLGIYCCQAVARSLAKQHNPPYPRSIVVTLVLSVTACGLCAAQILSTAELAGLAVPTERNLGVAASPLSYVITVLLPGFYGSNSLESYWGGADITQAYLYYGVLPLLLLPFAFRGARANLAVSFAGLFSFGLLVAVGAKTTLASFLSLILPGLIARGAYGFPFRVLSDLTLALLVGLGIESLLHGQRDAEDKYVDCLVNLIALGIGIVLSVFFVAIYGILLVQGTNSPGPTSGLVHNRLDAVMTEDFVAAFVLAWGYGAVRFVRSRPREVTARAVLISALTLPLVLAGSGTAMNTGTGNPRSIATDVPAPANSLRQLGVSVLGDGRYDRSDDDAQLWGTMTQLWGLQSANGNDPFLIADYQKYREAFVTGPQSSRTIHQADYRSRLADLLGLRYVVISGDGPSRQTLLDNAHWRMVLKDGNNDVYENQRAVPRVFFASSAQVLPLDDTLAAIKSETFDPYQRVILAPGGSTETLPSSGVRRTAFYHAVSTDRNDISVSDGPPGWLVVTDTYFPGWVARIDGQPTTLRRADFLFQSVYVDSGPHIVTFSFEPLSIRVGLTVTVVTWLAAIAVGIVTLVGSIRSRRSDRVEHL